MKTVTEHIRERLLKGIILFSLYNLSDLKKTEWSDRFERLQRNRLLVGAYRYGLLNAPGKSQYNRCDNIKERLKKYIETGNLEFLVDIANLAMLEFEEGKHPNRHFKSIDDVKHVSVR
jgi:hypothetical protein